MMMCKRKCDAYYVRRKKLQADTVLQLLASNTHPTHSWEIQLHSFSDKFKKQYCICVITHNYKQL